MTLRRSLTDWLTDMDLIPAAINATVDRYIGYYEPYATSHDALDRDSALFQEVRNVAKSVVEAVKLQRAGRLPRPRSRGYRPAAEVERSFSRHYSRCSAVMGSIRSARRAGK